MSEAQFQSQVLALARAMGLLVYHTHDSRRSEPGFPDLVIVGANGVLFRELKTETGRVSPDQLYWHCALAQAGSDVAVWRPEDFPDRVQADFAKLGRCRAERPSPSQAQIRKQLQKRVTKSPV